MSKLARVVGWCGCAMALMSACATKGFVRGEVTQVNEKVTTLGSSLEETQERVRGAEQKIGEVDGKVVTAEKTAQQASNTASAAMKTGAQALDVGKQAAARADAVEASSRKLILETVLTDDQAKFGFAATELSPAARAAIDQIVNQLTAQKSAIWVEIEGHTDSTGPADYNEQLGLQRAEAVKRYLYERHNIPLHKMNAISFGEEKPVGENRSREGRSTNRRVVIKVLG